jgi:hypothetical protein
MLYGFRDECEQSFVGGGDNGLLAEQKMGLASERKF